MVTGRWASDDKDDVDTQARKHNKKQTNKDGVEKKQNKRQIAPQPLLVDPTLLEKVLKISTLLSSSSILEVPIANYKNFTFLVHTHERKFTGSRRRPLSAEMGAGGEGLNMNTIMCQMCFLGWLIRKRQALVFFSLLLDERDRLVDLEGGGLVGASQR